MNEYYFVCLFTYPFDDLYGTIWLFDELSLKVLQQNFGNYGFWLSCMQLKY